MKKIAILFIVMQLGCASNKNLPAKISIPVVLEKNFNSVNIVFAQRTGQRYKDYIDFPESSSFEDLFQKELKNKVSRRFIPVSYDVTKNLFSRNGFNEIIIDKRFIIDTTVSARIAYAGNNRPRTAQWITSAWIHKTALDIQKSKPYQLDSVLIRTGYLGAKKNDLIFYIFHDVRNPSVDARPSGNYAGFGQQSVNARSYVFGILDKKVIYFKDHFYKARYIQKLDSVEVAKITYSLFEDFFKAVKK